MPTSEAVSDGTAGASQPRRHDAQHNPDDDRAAPPASTTKPRRIRLGARGGARTSWSTSGAASDGAAPEASLERAGSWSQGRSVLSHPNSRGNRATSEEEGAPRPASTTVARPGSSAGLRPRTPCSSSWRPVVAVDQRQDAAAGRRREGGSCASGSGSLDSAGVASDDETSDGEAQALPAEDPYVRLLREREREWRGRTLQMMSGGEEDDGGSLVDRYVRLGR